ncbi:uncharacterized protein LOC116345567 [Contarinia nasturtii]|uniref:uncharacterized protein LOC116345567 n=1 Tax=Contarinia nasturtii TaxID=265458 RepID=UPI0012D40D0A|nr:uncharacterized protein LOC116345567 [Contarinia nasturtii]
MSRLKCFTLLLFGLLISEYLVVNGDLNVKKMISDYEAKMKFKPAPIAVMKDNVLIAPQTAKDYIELFESMSEPKSPSSKSSSPKSPLSKSSSKKSSSSTSRKSGQYHPLMDKGLSKNEILEIYFNKAVKDAKKFKTTPEFQDLRELYALYQQAVVGDNNTKSPKFDQIIAYADWYAWDKKKGMKSAEAKLDYIKEVFDSILKYGLSDE